MMEVGALPLGSGVSWQPDDEQPDTVPPSATAAGPPLTPKPPRPPSANVPLRLIEVRSGSLGCLCGSFGRITGPTAVAIADESPPAPPPPPMLWTSTAVEPWP